MTNLIYILKEKTSTLLLIYDNTTTETVMKKKKTCLEFILFIKQAFNVQPVVFPSYTQQVIYLLPIH